MTTDSLDAALEDALPRCPKCLVALDVEGDKLPHFTCRACGDVWF